MEETLEDLEKELVISVGSPIDTSLSADSLSEIRASLRRQHVIEFRGFKEAMEVSLAIGESEAADRQKEAAKKALKAIAEIDRRLKNGSAA